MNVAVFSAKRSSVAGACALVLALWLQSVAHATPDNVDELIHAALLLDAHPQTGKTVYTTHCASCHGPKGEGNWRRNIPTLAGQRLAYLIKQLADFSQRDRDSEAMHHVVASKMSGDPQTWMDTAAFVNSLPPARSVQIGEGAKLLLGEAIFREQCSSCHEEDGRGDDDGFVPSLRNQHFSYLLRQMRALMEGHRRNVDSDLDLFLNSFKEDEMRATADYLSRMKGPTKDRSQMRSNGVLSN